MLSSALLHVDVSGIDVLSMLTMKLDGGTFPIVLDSHYSSNLLHLQSFLMGEH